MSLQEKAVKNFLKSKFYPHINDEDIKQRHTGTNLEDAVLSRSLAALIIAHYCHFDFKYACGYVTDESGDRGIDAIGIDTLNETLYVVQSKLANKGPSLTEVQKFISGIKLLIDGEFNNLGPKLKQHKDELTVLYEEWENPKIQAVYVHLGDVQPNDEVLGESSRFEKEVNNNGEILHFDYLRLIDVYNIKNQITDSSKIDEDVEFQSWTAISEWKEGIIGILRGDQIAKLVEKHHSRLFASNIRQALGDTGVNVIMTKGAKVEPEEFVYYNNGITIVVDKIAAPGRVRPSTGSQQFSLSGMNIVNGAQTCTSVSKAIKDKPEIADSLFVTARVISLEDQPDDFKDNITRFTNSQNQIGGRDFVALDKWQKQIKEALAEEKIQYLLRNGELEDTENFDEAFTLDEATKAMAAYSGVEEATRAKREIGKLYADTTKEPYLRIFKRSYTAELVYNVVRFWRAVNELNDELVASADGRSRIIIYHANYLLCALLFEQLEFEGYDLKSLESDPASWVRDNSDMIKTFVYQLVKLHNSREHNPTGYPQPFFKNIHKIQDFADGAREIIRPEADA